MRKFVAVALLLASSPALSQTVTRTVKVRAVLVDKDLNQKPVPHLAIVFTADPDSSHDSIEIKTDFDGNADLLVPPGKYRVSTPQGVNFEGRHYVWQMAADLTAETISLELSNDNALTTDLPPDEPARKTDDLTTMFRKYEKSVVTVWSEIGSGTGFIVDPAGLVLTNQHVIGPSELISVQFDAKRKVAATLLAFDAERDIAVLYVNLEAFPDALSVPITSSKSAPAIAVEGENVFAIGSPLNLKKIITGGIVSKIEPHAIISDVNINHGNSGGPLFNSAGEVIGITTFLIPGENGPGVSGIVPIDQALPVLEKAQKKMKDVPLPSARLLPVEPADRYPLSSLKEMVHSEKFDIKPYVFTIGGFDVVLGTPVLDYELREGVGLNAAQEKGKRTKKRSGSPRDSFEPLQDVREWTEYVGAYKPVLLVQAEPQLRETFMSKVDRSLVPAGGGSFGIPAYGLSAHMRFKTDFYRMKLFCGEKEIEPVQPGKAATIVNAHNTFVHVTDATYVGIYSYPPDAISPSCGRVTLQLFSEKEPDKPESKDLDQKSIERVWSDFRPYLAIHGNSERAQ